MTGEPADDTGRSLFSDADTVTPVAKHSVFAAVDQDKIIAQIDAVEDDDLSSTFFEDSMQEVEDAAAHMFDIGIKTMTVDPRAADGAGAFGSGPTPPARVAPGVSSSGPRHASETAVSAGAAAADQFRKAFILGGPAAAKAAKE